MYQAYIRRFRPRSFQEVVGQEGITNTLMKAVETGRVANAYLFAGLRGVGKTSTARILAKALNCRKGPTPDPCNECESCLAIHRGEDLDVVEIDAASNTSVDHMRALRESAIYSPARSRYKVYIIDEAHMLSVAAFNALLKILEEPPEHVKFIFATTEPNRIPETVRSRMQRFDFRPIGTRDIARRLRQIADEEGVGIDDEVLVSVSRRARGGLRDAESLLDQLTTLAYGRQVTREDVLSLTGTIAEERLSRLLAAAIDGKPAEVTSDLEALYSEGAAPADLLEQIHGILREAMLALAGGGERASSEIPAEVLEALTSRLKMADSVALLGMLGHYRFEMRYAPDPQAVLEVALLRIASGEVLQDISLLLGAAQNVPHSATDGVERNTSGKASTPAPVEEPRPAAHPEPAAPAWWTRVLEGIDDPGLQKCLSNAVPSEPGKGGRVILRFTRKFHRDRAEGKLSAVAAALKKALGRPVQIELVCEQGENDSEQQSDLFSHPEVRRIVTEFDGHVEKVE